VTFIGRNKKMPGGKLLTERLLALPGINGIHLSINPERSSYMMGETFIHLAGHRRTGFHLGGEKFLLSPGSFFQTSATGAELLVSQVLRALPDQIHCLAGLYGGVGVFSRLSRKKWKKAVIAESNPWAIGDLRHWLKKEPRADIKIYEGRVESLMQEIFSANPDVVLLDPPRVGLHERVVQKIMREKPPVLVYVSCGIDALVRDGKQFVESGYRVDHVSAVDMFPHTSHLEVVTRFVLP
jgi:23S rRNA (uracil1939-C5)-methyltransferase